MKLRLMLALVLMAACTDSVFASVSTEAATALARRILGEQCDRIRFQDVSRNKADAEFFTVEDSDGGILVSGTGAPAMAMGLNWYLRYRCKVDVSWYSHDPVRCRHHCRWSENRSRQRRGWPTVSSLIIVLSVTLFRGGAGRNGNASLIGWH